MTNEKNKDIKSLQEENARLQDLLSAREDMVSISAHQIRTSLSALKWIIKMFLDGELGNLPPEQESLMKKAYEGNERAISIVSELLLANKTENVLEKEYVFSKIDLAELIHNSIFDFSGEASNKGVELIFLNPNEKISQVWGDKEKIRVVLSNLLENAIKYSNQHDKVFVTTTEKIPDDGKEKFVEVSIRDTGIGISEEGKKRIFEKFYRDPVAQKKESVGSGIGLFSVKKIVEKQGGKIWFNSEEGKGTNFFFTIPASKE